MIMARIAVLISDHSVVARLKEGELNWVSCVVNNQETKNLLQVVTIWSDVYQCDSIRYIDE